MLARRSTACVPGTVQHAPVHALDVFCVVCDAGSAAVSSLFIFLSVCWQGNHTVGFGGKVAFVEGGEGHRTHSGHKEGLATNNAGPLIDIALLSEATVT